MNNKNIIKMNSFINNKKINIDSQINSNFFNVDTNFEKKSHAMFPEKRNPYTNLNPHVDFIDNEQLMRDSIRVYSRGVNHGVDETLPSYSSANKEQKNLCLQNQKFTFDALKENRNLLLDDYDIKNAAVANKKINFESTNDAINSNFNVYTYNKNNPRVNKYIPGMVASPAAKNDCVYVFNGSETVIKNIDAMRDGSVNQNERDVVYSNSYKEVGGLKNIKTGPRVNSSINNKNKICASNSKNKNTILKNVQFKESIVNNNANFFAEADAQKNKSIKNVNYNFKLNTNSNDTVFVDEIDFSTSRKNIGFSTNAHNYNNNDEITIENTSKNSFLKNVDFFNDYQFNLTKNVYCNNNNKTDATLNVQYKIDDKNINRNENLYIDSRAKNGSKNVSHGFDKAFINKNSHVYVANNKTRRNKNISSVVDDIYQSDFENGFAFDTFRNASGRSL